MGKLLKYEFRKTMFMKWVLLGITALAEVLYLYGHFADKENALATGALLLTFIAIVGITLVGIMSVISLHKDMNTRQGYMLFMTPNSCFKILGAKVLECGLSLAVAGAFFFLLGMLDIQLLLSRVEENIWQFLLEMLRTINERIEFTVPNMLAVTFFLLSSFLCAVTTAYLADVIASALLKGKRANWIVSFIFFILLTYVTNKIALLVPSTLTVVAQFCWEGIISLALAAGMYFVTAWLMDRYLSV